MAGTKAIESPFLAWQDIANATQVISADLDCTTISVLAVAIRLGRGTGTGFTAGWPNVRIEASFAISGNNSWIPLYIFQPMTGANVASTTLNGAVSAGASSFIVTSATNISTGDILFLGDASPANYELVRVKGTSGTSITPEDLIVHSHTTGALVTDQASMIYPAFDLSPYLRARVVADNANSGQAIRLEVLATSFTS